MAFEPRILRPDEEHVPASEAGTNESKESASRGGSASRRLDWRRDRTAREPKLFCDFDQASRSAISAGARRDELSLPDDLAELASQLSADAARLERLYPADRWQTSGETAGTWLLRIAAAVLLVACSVWWGAHRKHAADEKFASGAAATGRAEANHDLVARANDVARPKTDAFHAGAAPSDAALLSGKAPPISRPSTAAASWLDELTNPQREAALDLLEQQPTPLASLSI